MKKSLTYAVVIATIVWSMGLGALVSVASAAYAPVAGDIIKVNGTDRPAVYVVGDDLKPYVFSTRNTYGSWLDDFSSLKNITQEEFDSMNLGGNVTVRPGSLIRFDNSNVVYAALPGNKLCRLPADADAKALYGNDYAARVMLIQVSFVGNYTFDSSCTMTKDSLLPDGSLIQYAESSDIYYIENGLKRMVSSEAFLANRFRNTNVVRNMVATRAYDSGMAIGGEETEITSFTLTNRARAMFRAGQAAN